MPLPGDRHGAVLPQAALLACPGSHEVVFLDCHATMAVFSNRRVLPLTGL